MKQEELTNFIKFEFDKLEKLLAGKGHDYNNDDRLSAFKIVAQNTGLSVKQIFNVMINIKTVRLSNILEKETINESLEDTINDLIGYGVLFKAYLKEQSEIS